MKSGSLVVVKDRLSKYESIVYAVLWLFILLLPFLNEILKVSNGLDFSWCSIVLWWLGLLPYIAIFAINNFILVPKFLFRKLHQYILLSGLMLLLFLIIQGLTYSYRMEAVVNIQNYMENATRPVASYRFLGLPMPIVMNLALALLLLAINTSIISVFRYLREKENREVLEMTRLKDELKFLKAQINPHFFMNMLNNIHAMIELDSEKAQDMTLELSKLMRYVLYEGENVTTTLADEVSFLTSYVNLMRRRYPESKVEIMLDVPENPSREVIVTPMLFVTFVENAFKHGISYQKKSRISISLNESDGMVCFLCRNTRSSGVGNEISDGGLGLDNVRRRLSLLYGESYDLRIDETKEFYKVELTIPSL